MKPRVVALDLSLTGTGIASYDGIIPQVSTVDGKRLRGHDRLAEIHRAVADLVLAVRPIVVVIEDLPALQMGDTSLRLAELHGLVKHWLYLRGFAYVLVQPAQLKLYAVGKGGGKGTDKDTVLLAVADRYRDLVRVSNNNESDALVLLAMALDHYGAPLAAVPATHRAALTKVTGWPDLTREG